ncbi:MAG TPA: excinuclease ABC subunit UvrA [Chitinophagaceae bacterium]|nr:excinuclease ABC subunit UvrA [Chitinophagaceae bacterium]HNF71367.1 excinuclease ABC subunit UvrA [Chitinophagaceae bacterium]
MKAAGNDLVVKGARMHNLKNVHVVFPHGKLIVVTGVSGSGKSSLTMDTLFAEGQRRYVESLSSYARQFMKSMQKPDVDSIEGLCPAIAIEQKVSARTPRSTVGSMTEMNDYFRLLFARIGKTISPVSGNEVRKDEVSDVIRFIAEQKKESKILILIPFPSSSQKNTRFLLDDLLQKGFTRLYLPETKEYVQIEECLSEPDPIPWSSNSYILIDRLVVRSFEESEWHRITDSIQTAMDETLGDVYLEVDGHMHHFCNRFELDGIRFEEPSPNFFSGNNPYGACPECEGFGMVTGIDPALVIPDRNLSVYEGAVVCWNGEKMQEWKKAFLREHRTIFPVHKPVRELTKAQYDLLWNGTHGIQSFFDMVSDNLYKIQYRVLQARYRGKTKCPACNGYRIRKDALYVKVGGEHIGELMQWPVAKLAHWLQELTLSDHDNQIAKRLLNELQVRLQTMLDVGLGYLSLQRTANTLSGGESQRIQLTRVIGSNLTDSLYILDEPSIGLHARDTERLIRVLKRLRDLGNTVVVVEHDDLMMREADYIIDMGPLASHLGGEVVAAGNYATLLKSPLSLTARYLSGAMTVHKPGPFKKPVNRITVSQCHHHNLKGFDLSIPLNMLCVVSGVSGSGKTTLVKHILYPALLNHFGDFTQRPGEFGALSGDLNAIQSVEMVDQNPIGKSSRSNPVTYIKAYDEIRNLFAAQQLSKIRGYSPGYFSFNVEGGRCDTCQGEGEIVVEMQFLADVHLTCEICKGKRFKNEVQEVLYKGKSITDVLEMSVDEALEFFSAERKLAEKLGHLQSVGLGYIKLGQSSNTLSGGEAQRVKLASFLDRSYHQKRILFIFDEPTTGLHFHDIQKLLNSFEALIDNGHSLLVIEHNPDVIRNADWVIDLGPEGGEAGGNILYEGSASGLRTCSESYTGRYL